MDFGLFYYCQGRGVPHDQAYHEMLDEIVLAETLGFSECWFAEHHFTDYSLLPSPNLMIASAVQQTRHMRFGNYVNAMSFHHPLRLAYASPLKPLCWIIWPEVASTSEWVRACVQASSPSSASTSKMA